MTRRRPRFTSESDRAAAIASIANALFYTHGEDYTVPEDVRRALEARLRGYLFDDHTGCAKCDLELTLEAATAEQEQKEAAPVMPLRRPT